MSLKNLNPLSEAEIPGSIARDVEITAAIGAHSAATDPHPAYLSQTEGDARYRQTQAPETLFDTSKRLVSLFPNTGNLASQGSGQGGFECRAAAGTGVAALAFHKPGSYASYFGLDTDGVLKFGGWSVNAAFRCWHEGYGTPVWQTPSDSRLKKSVRPIESALHFITQAKPVSFEYRPSTIGGWGESDYQRKKVHYGFLAEEFPLKDLVSVKPNGWLGLDYIEIIPFLVRAIQELASTVESLNSEMEGLKGEREGLWTEIEGKD